MDWIQLGLKVGMYVIFVIGGLFVLGLVYLVTWFIMTQKSYSKYKVIVWERYETKEGGELFTIVDLDEKGRVQYDKKLKKHYFYLKNAKIHLGEEETKNYDELRDLDVPSTPYGKGGQIVYVEKIGLKKYAFGEPFLIFGKPSIIISAADCAEAVRSFDINAKTFGKKKKDLLAFTLYVIFALAIMIIVIVLLTKLEVLSSEGIKVTLDNSARMAGAAVSSGAPT